MDEYKEIERSIIKKYRKEIWSRFIKAVQEYELINEGDKVVDAKIIPKNTTKLVSITSDGYIKNSDLSEFHITNRGTKGVKIQRTEDFCNFLPIENDLNILIISSTAQIKIKIDDIPNLGRGAQGVKSIKLLSNSKIISLQKLDG